MSLLNTVTEGGQIWAHKVRMAKQVLRIVLVVSLVAGLVVFFYQMKKIPQLNYQAAWYYFRAQLSTQPEEKITVSSEFWSQVTRKKFPQETIAVEAGQVMNKCEKKFLGFCSEAEKAFKMGMYSTFLACGGALVFFLFNGWYSRRKKHLGGQRLSSSWLLSTRLKLGFKASPFRIGSLPLIKGTESRHILISGGTGSGKTNCFHHILPQIRAQGQKAVIVDTTGEFVSKYYREGKDILMNPFDKRSVTWHPWCECREPYDYKALAQSFIPSSYREEENFWRKSAQEVFSSLLQMLAEEKKMSNVIKLILYASLPDLHSALEHTKAASFLDLSSEKTAGSIRAVAASFLECLELFQDTETPFSIRDWVNDEKKDNWLFLTSTTGQRASLTPVISSWFSIAMRSLLNLSQDNKRRLWFIADELPSLQRLHDLETCLTESRKFGGCALLAIQSPAQLEMIYGQHLAKTLIGNCSTRIAFAEQDPETAARISKIFGEKETKELHEGISYGAHEMRDGVSLSFQNKTSAVVTPTAIQSLNIHEAFVKLPGVLPITKLKLSYINQPIIGTNYQAKDKDKKNT